MQFSRRRIIIGTTALATAGTGLALGTREAGAQADVELGELTAEDGEFSPVDGQAHAIYLLLTGQYEYQVNKQPEEWQAYALVGDGSGSTEAIALTSGAADALEDAGTFALRGPITAASFYSSSTFSVPDGQSEVSVTIPVTVVFLVRDTGGNTLVQARESAEAVVTINDDAMPKVAVAGSASLAMQDDETDPTPEFPEA